MRRARRGPIGRLDAYRLLDSSSVPGRSRRRRARFGPLHTLRPLYGLAVRLRSVWIRRAGWLVESRGRSRRLRTYATGWSRWRRDLRVLGRPGPFAGSRLSLEARTERRFVSNGDPRLDQLGAGPRCRPRYPCSSRRLDRLRARRVGPADVAGTLPRTARVQFRCLSTLSQIRPKASTGASVATAGCASSCWTWVRAGRCSSTLRPRTARRGMH